MRMVADLLRRHSRLRRRLSVSHLFCVERPRDAMPPEVVSFSSRDSLREEPSLARSDPMHPLHPAHPNTPPSEGPARGVGIYDKGFGCIGFKRMRRIALGRDARGVATGPDSLVGRVIGTSRRTQWAAYVLLYVDAARSWRKLLARVRPALRPPIPFRGQVRPRA